MNRRVLPVFLIFFGCLFQGCVNEPLPFNFEAPEGWKLVEKEVAG